MKYVIFGLPGVGKTTVVEKVIDNTGIRRVHWGDLTMDAANDLGLAKTRDDIRKLHLSAQKEIRREVTERVIAISKEERNVLVETHAAIKTPQGYWPGLSRITLEKFSPDVYIVLTAKPEFLFARRLKDLSRDRADELSIDSVRTVQDITRQMAITYSALSSGTFVEVENKEGDVDYAVNIISEIINSGQNPDELNLDKKYPFQS